MDDSKKQRKTMKSWSYKEITAEAEAQIKNLKEKERVSTDPDMRRIYSHMAEGVLHLWRSITLGWMTENDQERLEKLLAPVPTSDQVGSDMKAV